MPARTDFAPGEFCWIDLAAHDMEAAAAWYDALFGWQHRIAETPGGGPPYAFWMQGDAGIGGLGQMSEEMKAQGIPPVWNSYVCTKDCAAFEKKVASLGGTVTVPTIDIPDHGKLAYFLDPEGASFAAWQATSDGGPSVLVGEPNSLCWNELMTRDPKKAQQFYGDLVGWDFATETMDDTEFTMLKVGGKDAGGMMPMNGPRFERVPANWLVYFAVADCDETAAAAEKSGGAIQVPPTEIPFGRFSVLSDPQGAVFCVIALSPARG